jgi:hypothetical protein
MVRLQTAGLGESEDRGSDGDRLDHSSCSCRVVWVDLRRFPSGLLDERVLMGVFRGSLHLLLFSKRIGSPHAFPFVCVGQLVRTHKTPNPRFKFCLRLLWGAKANSFSHRFGRVSLRVETFQPPSHACLHKRVHFLSVPFAINSSCPANAGHIEGFIVSAN